MAHTHLARLSGAGGAGSVYPQNFDKKTLNHFRAHGSTFFTGAFSRRRRVTRRKWWNLALGETGSHTLPCKVVKVVFLEVFFVCASAFPLVFSTPRSDDTRAADTRIQAEPPWRGGQRGSRRVGRRADAALPGINSAARAEARRLFAGLSYSCACFCRVDIAMPKVSFLSWKRLRSWPSR